MRLYGFFFAASASSTMLLFAGGLAANSLAEKLGVVVGSAALHFLAVGIGLRRWDSYELGPQLVPPVLTGAAIGFVIHTAFG